MSERFKQIRKAVGLNQEDFGQKLGVAKSTISRIESGTNNLTKQMIVSTCQVFNVNEKWLRTGKGEMFQKLSREETAARMVGQMLNTDNDFVKKALIALGKLSPADWKTIEKFIDNIKKED